VDYPDSLGAKKATGQQPLTLAFRFPEPGNGKTGKSPAIDMDHVTWDRRRVVRSPHGPAGVFDGPTMALCEPPPGTIKPARGALTFGAWIRPAEPSGIVGAFGGRSHGVSLSLHNGRPRFAVRSRGKLYTAAADQPVAMGRWHHLAGRITRQGALELWVNGQRRARSEGAVLQKRPRDGLSIGGDSNSPVTAGENVKHFTGHIADLRFYTGELEAGAFKTWGGRSSQGKNSSR